MLVGIVLSRFGLKTNIIGKSISFTDLDLDWLIFYKSDLIKKKKKDQFILLNHSRLILLLYY